MIRSRIALTSLLLSALGLASCGSSAALRAETEAPSGPITHSFLACGSNTRIVDGSGEVVWSYRLGSQDGQVLPNDNVLLAVKRCAEFPRGAVVEVTRDGEETVVWVGEQHEIHTVCPLADGRILVAEGGPKPRLLEIERSGEVVAVIPLACQTDDFHMGTRMARKLDDGTYLVPHLLDFAVKQYDAEGQVIAVFDTTAPGDPGHAVHTWPFTAIRLPNGNTHVNLTHSNQVVQYDASGEVVWRLTNDDLPEPWLADPCGAQVLPNGNVVIACYGQTDAAMPKLLEVTPAKEVVWTYHDEIPHSVHGIHVLDDRGVPLAGAPMK